jgi:hypothetical protein
MMLATEANLGVNRGIEKLIGVDRLKPQGR